MPPQSPMPTPVPTAAPNPVMMALLKARAQQGAAGGGVPPAPNAMATGAGPVGAPPQVGGNQMPARPGAPTPVQGAMKAAAGAQSPLVTDPQTRALAKTLIQKLMQHM